MELAWDEKIIYTSGVTKFNHRDKAQLRYLMVTNKAVYNIKQSKLSFCGARFRIKRKIVLRDILGISISSDENEFVVHVASEHDYRMRCTTLKNFVEVLTTLYTDSTEVDLSIFKSNETVLKSICTTKRDIKNDISRRPIAISFPVFMLSGDKKSDALWSDFIEGSDTMARFSTGCEDQNESNSDLSGQKL
mmetsp:Transcript_20692/g.23412  ORF Transcript_20692/g.23412 Transcript_20692/m.23412 type:complete len:191 (+) Transcript_20692:407-979(+)|eukprot:CAMPEP_0114997286 /NCGR_PEP_ID=MMETSP0216-20121206/14808_1 /TAXON_ID=223996 /ORGANISM="Protocruzia adherens, Strain Boccale" /LENGTH=190 /DNA_ID=CAMNT_0002361637 /DNA_START=398 /DNA_END=970 /DNA_ORIENTATION=-